jgi:hypothetical protein
MYARLLGGYSCTAEYNNMPGISQSALLTDEQSLLILCRSVFADGGLASIGSLHFAWLCGCLCIFFYLFIKYEFSRIWSFTFTWHQLVRGAALFCKNTHCSVGELAMCKKTPADAALPRS